MRARSSTRSRTLDVEIALQSQTKKLRCDQRFGVRKKVQTRIRPRDKARTGGLSYDLFFFNAACDLSHTLSLSLPPSLARAARAWSQSEPNWLIRGIKVQH
jgi:hypothetical protein